MHVSTRFKRMNKRTIVRKIEELKVFKALCSHLLLEPEDLGHLRGG